MKEKTAYRLVSLISVLISLAGVPFAVWVTRIAADGARGGAIGVSIALLFLFMNRDYGAKLYTALMQDLPELKARLEQGQVTSVNSGSIEDRIAKLEKEVSTLVRRINIEAEGQRDQSKFLAVATAIGTMLWGFGDALAQCLINHFSTH